MLKANEELISDLIEKRRTLHAYPETAFEEYETTARIKEWLEAEGVSVLPYDLETGIVAEVKGDNPGPTIALRADIDALPIEEEAEVPFKSTVHGKMHACGHDFHTASIFGAARLLNENKDKINGTVRLIFQPAEEVAEGAEWLTEKGVLEGVSAIFGMHNKPDLPVGTIGIKSGTLMASVDRFKFTFKGIGGHAGLPHEAIDPIIIASQFVLSVQSIISRKIDLFHNAVISITHIKGGSTWNVIPGSVMVEGTVRTFQPEAREKIKEEMRKQARLLSESQGGEVLIDWDERMPTIYNDSRFEKSLKQTTEELGYSVVEAQPVAGGEDFAYYQQTIPGFFVWMGSNGPFQWHDPKFTLDEGAIKVASEFFANLALTVLKDFSN